MTAPCPSLCTPWATTDDVTRLRGTTTPDVTEFLLPASDLLFEASRRLFPGSCQDTVRPCARRSVADVRPAWHGTVLDGLPGSNFGWGGLGWQQSWGVCLCNMPLSRQCGCSGLSEITLGGEPATSIVEVLIDGEVLDPAKYTVHDNRWLVRVRDPDGTWHAWPCFPAGTAVLTSEGLKPIEQVAPGDRVLTHRNRWRTVLRAGQTGESETVRIVGRGGSISATPDHRFLACEVAGRPGQRKLGAPGWVDASNLVQHAWAMPRYVEPLPIPLPEDWTTETLPSNFWWLIGRWLGDGWTANGTTSGDRGVVICAGHHEADQLAAALLATGWRWRRHDSRTTVRFTTSDKALREWLRRYFGAGAAGKRLPAWLLGADETIREAVLTGYVSADGWRAVPGGKQSPFTSVHTVSRDLAVALRLLVASLGYAPMMYEAPGSPNPIEGRAVAARTAYRVDWPDTRPGEARSQAWSDDEHLWGRVRSVELDETVVPVFDLEVEDDNSFVADGFVVHNCCQDMTKPSTEPGTWQVTFTYGTPPPSDGVLACVDLALELARLNSEGDCALPPRITSMIRQGVQVALLDPLAVVAAGGTGVYSVDLFLQPYRKRTRPATVHVPAWRNPVSRDTGA